MDYKRIFWGAILVILGVALILKNIGLVYFSWHAVWHLWPILLILWGVSLLPVKDIWKLIASLVILILTIFFLYKYPHRFQSDWPFHWNDNDEDYTTGTTNQNFDEPFDSLTRYAVINLDAAAGKFVIQDSSSRLIEFTNKGDIGNYGMEVQKVGDSSIIGLNMHSHDQDNTITNHDMGNKVTLKLNPKPSWSFNMDVGAADMEMDLRNFKVDRIELDGGASSVNIQVGKLQPETHLDLETGASSINIHVPKEAGCEVENSSFLSSRHLKDFIKTGDGKYRTSNFSTATQKIFISLDAAVSSVDIVRE